MMQSAVKCWIIFAIALLCVLPAYAQQAQQGRAVSTCSTPGITYTNGSAGPLTLDLNGNLCVDISSGGSISPQALTTTQIKLTISVTNTYQQALASAAGRKGCTLQYVAVAGIKGYVFFGSAPADTTTSWQLTNGQSISCAVGGLGMATDAVQVTATATDIFIVSSQ